jgi:homoserine O-acetyltransferase
MFKQYNIQINSFQLDSGDESGDLEVACCFYGSLDKPVVVLLGGISASCYALDCPNFQQPNTKRHGWWQEVLGQSALLTTENHCFLTFEYFSFAENKVNPPIITTADQAKLLFLIQQKLSLPQFHAMIGSSYGGMVSLAFASLYPTELKHLVCIAAADYNSVKSQALRNIQRNIIDLGRQFGKDTQDQQQFVALARALAMVGYRGETELEQRFQSTTSGEALAAVDSYLSFHGARFAKQFSASRYSQLSRSIDYHQVDVSTIIANTLLIGINSDQMVPTAYINDMGKSITGPCQTKFIDSTYGHDGFLLEADQLNNLFNTFFEEHSHDYFERNHRCASGY